jgi:hypothetical protein
MNSRPYVLVAFLGTALLVGGAVVYFTFRPGREISNPGRPDPAAQNASPEASVADALGPDVRARLPADRVLLAPDDAAECRGLVVSGESSWGVKELGEKSVLWDEGKRHLVVLLPNEKLSALQEKLTPK